MECLPVESIPEGDAWTYELKLDGYHMIGVKSGKLALRSRRGTDMTMRSEDVAVDLAGMPDETMIDGEVRRSRRAGHAQFQTASEFSFPSRTSCSMPSMCWCTMART